MAGRPKHFENEELIEKATKVFWKKGFIASSAQDLLKAMEIGQGSFYRSFPGGKRELYQKSLFQFVENANKQFSKGIEESQDPIEFLNIFFTRIIEQPKPKSNNGCYLGNAIVELSNLDEETKELSVKLLLKLESGFEAALIKAQNMGKLDNDKSPKLIAMHLINLWNGLNITQKMYTDKKALKSLLKMNLQILN
ncbi:TetR/AcrR family transcriptional regulator [Polaribacter staleyi]|uniref:TetR/AcrR family transcriptional regulator n=1 Tax=Polaribacter staleyi TaxID=2022337 RepID=UPI0031BB6552